MPVTERRQASKTACRNCRKAARRPYFYQMDVAIIKNGRLIDQRNFKAVPKQGDRINIFGETYFVIYTRHIENLDGSLMPSVIVVRSAFRTLAILTLSALIALLLFLILV